MNMTLRRGARIAAMAGFIAVATTLAQGCHSITDPLLNAPDPDIIDPKTLSSTDGSGAEAARIGTLQRFRNITAGAESTWLFGGLLADEWSTSSTFVQNDETDERRIQENNGSITTMVRSLARVRTSANQAIAALRAFPPAGTTPWQLAEMYLARGFAELQLASDFCNGIPLSDFTATAGPLSGLPPTSGMPLPVAEVFARGLVSVDSGLATTALTSATASTGEKALNDTIRWTLQVTKGRLLLGLGRQADAVLAVQTANGVASVVPTGFVYNQTFATTSGDNIIWSQGASARRYTIGDSLEGNARNLLVLNAIPFFSLNDPRLGSVRYSCGSAACGASNPIKDTVKSQDGFTFSRTTNLWGRSSPIAVANGTDARLVEAEGKFKAGDNAGMLAILNALRAAPPKVADIQPAVLPPLVDPGTDAKRLDLLFREKALWTFGRGQRLGDLRRLIRQYGRTPANTFPIGTHYRGLTYGSDVNLPIVTDERANPNFHGCTDRNA
ncbi:MAG: hypothetical protein M3081_08020 [Gemmatimonadota bacterium]|nr:hypothetical protein [Gemmatimonadota bacterium]